MINGCLVLVAAMAIITTLAGKFAGLPPFHVVVATVTLMFALMLARTAPSGTTAEKPRDYRWQIDALAAIGAPALLSAVLGYGMHMEGDALSGTSVYLYLAGTAVYLIVCFVRYKRDEGDPTKLDNQGEDRQP